jgi:hypothetical protein
LESVFKMKFDMMLFVISGFRGKDNELIPKEVAFTGIDLEGNRRRGCYLFEQPYPELELPASVREINNSIGKNSLGGLRWDDGHIAFSKWQDLVTSACSSVSAEGVILAKGSEQVDLLKSFLSNRTVQDLDSMDCPESECIVPKHTMDHAHEIYGTSCGFPTHTVNVCSMGKCLRYMLWWEKRERDRVWMEDWSADFMELLERQNREREEKREKEKREREERGEEEEKLPPRSQMFLPGLSVSDRSVLENSLSIFIEDESI